MTKHTNKLILSFIILCTTNLKAGAADGHPPADGPMHLDDQLLVQAIDLLRNPNADLRAIAAIQPKLSAAIMAAAGPDAYGMERFMRRMFENREDKGSREFLLASMQADRITDDHPAAKPYLFYWQELL